LANAASFSAASCAHVGPRNTTGAGVEATLQTGFFLTNTQLKLFSATIRVAPRVLHADPLLIAAEALGNDRTNRAKTIVSVTFLKGVRITVPRIVEVKARYQN
jgi:hypothetical protein